MENVMTRETTRWQTRTSIMFITLTTGSVLKIRFVIPVPYLYFLKQKITLLSSTKQNIQVYIVYIGRDDW